MSADFSVAPEIAQLAALIVPPVQDLLPAGPPAPATAGRLAADLTRLAANPRAWWDLIRFDPEPPVHVPVPVPGNPGVWLQVTPPGAITHCDCAYATLLAGEATEDGRPLRPGRVLVHGAGGQAARRGALGQGGAGHGLRGSDHGYAVSLHVFALCRTGNGDSPAARLSPLSRTSGISIAADAARHWLRADYGPCL